MSFLFSRTVTLVKRTPRGGLMRMWNDRRLVQLRAAFDDGRAMTGAAVVDDAVCELPPAAGPLDDEFDGAAGGVSASPQRAAPARGAGGSRFRAPPPRA